MKLFTILSFLLFISFPSWGKNYLLLVGINKYLALNELNGAVNDINSIEKLFLKQKDKNIKIIKLLNENATKSNILKTLNYIKDDIKEGDKFYFFYSGHGTGLKGKVSENLNSYNFPEELEYSGALVPYDGVIDNPTKSIQSLIWGYRDLKPILKEIDKKVSLSFISFDACFSGFTVRAIPINGQSRTIELPENIEQYIEEESKVPPYSYKNIIYLASSTNFETSRENFINVEYRGYISYYLERALKGEADFNQDSLITKKELEDYFYNKVLDKIPSTPVIYPRNSKENKVIFYLKKQSNYNNLTKNQILKIYLDGVNQSLFSGFKISSGINEATFIIKKKNNFYTLIYKPSGLNIMRTTDINKIKNYLSNFRLFFINTKSSNTLKVKIEKNGTPLKQLKIGESANLKIFLQNQAYILVFSIDKEGNVYLLEPLKFNQLLKSVGMDFEVYADKPVGVEFIKVFYIKNKDLIEKISNQLKSIPKKDGNTIIELNKDNIKILVKILKNNKNKWNSILYPFISYK